MNLIELAYHRNGVGGEGFHAIRFEDDGRQMLGVVFPYGANDNDRVAVFDAALLAKGDIAFGSNSFRGDHYARQLAQWIADRQCEIDA